jgi:hypothetical protein
MTHCSRPYNTYISDFTHVGILLRRKQNSKSFFLGILNSVYEILSGSSAIYLVDQIGLLVARTKGQAAKTKTAGIKPSHFLPSLLPQRDAGGKGWLGCKQRKPASGKRGIAAFFGEPNALLPGHGTPMPLGDDPSLLILQERMEVFYVFLRGGM